MCVIYFVIKAVHFKFKENFSTKTFLNALKRLIVRRGNSLEIFSDCGTNLKGAEKKINNQQSTFYTETRRKRITFLLLFLSSEEIIWTFNPPTAPHFGGH